MALLLQRTRLLLVSIGLLAASLGLPAVAHDHDNARQAVEAGEIRPLADILDAIRTQLPGDVVGVKLDRDDGAWSYELRVVDSKGRLFEIHVDAASGKVGRIREK